MGAIDLSVDVAGVDEEHGVGTLRVFGSGLALVEEPQRAGQRDGVEHVGADGDHDIDRPRLDQLLPQFLLGRAGIGGRVGHDEAGAAGGIERRVEELNPQVVGVVGARQAEGETYGRRRPCP
jgi:hypothetical protein